MRTLVTGIAGFVGGHLAEHLLACGDEIVGCSRRGAWPPGLGHLADRATLHSCDLADQNAAKSLVLSARPDAVVHLAALANPRECQANRVSAKIQNEAATTFLLDGIRASGQTPRILYVSTSYVYGQPERRELPVATACPVRIDNVYAESKWDAENTCDLFHKRYGLDIIRVRPFNHVGPRQPAGYIVSDWTRQVAAIERGDAEPILRVGNLDSRRDYTDVRDVVRAYRLLIERGQRGEVYNLGSGTSRSGREILDSLARLSRVSWRFEIDPARVRPDEAAEIVADATPLRKLTGWTPEISFDQTLADTLEYWRAEQGGTS
jgi:GDP-4-dehydro-6-deoxy-D-mannose reductase